MVPLLCIVRNKLDQLPQHSELKLQLNTIHDALVRRLDDVLVRKLDPHETDVHEYNQHIDGAELVQQLAGIRPERGAQEAQRLNNVYAAQDQLLQEEADHLHLLVDVEDPDEAVYGEVAVAAVGENCCRDVQDERVDDDHPFRPGEGLVAGAEEVQA